MDAQSIAKSYVFEPLQDVAIKGQGLYKVKYGPFIAKNVDSQASYHLWVSHLLKVSYVLFAGRCLADINV
jgi:hypothetical protein